MSLILLLIALCVLVALILLTKASYDTGAIKQQIKEQEGEEKEQLNALERIVQSRNFIYSGIVVCFLALLFIVYLFVKDSFYAGHFQEWMNIIIRWLHITVGIAWIGTSFLFVFMENSLHRDEHTRPELKGSLWMLHGGGFFFVEKYQVAPKVVPKELHWFKYEAYFTWLSGFMLLFVVYYFNAKAMLIDPAILDVPGYVGVMIGVGSLILGYLIYASLCRTPLLKHPLYFGIIGFAVLVAFAWGYTQVFTPRAAYIHFGALIGTLMAGNVFFVIIPSQKAMVQAAREGRSPDPWLGQYASLRSFHNNYFTLPVLFVMISNHFPSTFGHEYPWLILAMLSLGSAGIKHYFNLREKGQLSVWVMPIGILMLLATVLVTAPKPIGGACDEKIAFAEIYSIFNERCISCHSSRPTDDVWTQPPNGVVYDTPADMAKLADKIMLQVVVTKNMPKNNKTGITPEERDVIRCWIEQGAKLE